MKKSFALLTVLLVFMLAACSWNSEFIVVNDSSQPLTVVYKLDFPQNETPKILAASELEKSAYNWQTLAPQQFQFDREAKTYTVVLPPQQALRLAGLGTYTGHDTIHGGDDVEIQSLSVTGASGAINLSGELAQRAFANEKRDNYYFHYK
jgi:hypothetical protein